MRARYLAAGDRGLVVELGNAANTRKIDPRTNARVRALDEALRASPFPGYEEAIPAYRSLLVFYEPRAITFHGASEHIRELVKSLDVTQLSPTPVKEVPTVYDGDDLDDVARRAGVTRTDVIRQHSERDYLVYMVGFIPGFAYMGMTDAKLALPRKATPRTRVPAGSVGIAMGQTGIYPAAAPGGWHLLGRAEHRALFDPTASPPSFFVPGDRVRFVPVDALEGVDPEGVDPEGETESPAPTMTAALEVEDGGLLTTVQDLGRFGFQRHGVPVAGAMDPRALSEANELVANEPNAAGLECTVAGPTLRCLSATVAAIAGADLGALVERSDLGHWHPPLGSSFRLRPGNVLRFEGRRAGARAYIAFAGGIDVPMVVGSRSTYLMTGFGGYRGRALIAGDALSLLPSSGAVQAGRGRRLAPASSSPEAPTLRFIWGPQDDHFTPRARLALESSVYVVGAASDRMGYRLEGPKLEHRDVVSQQIISDGNALGSIQVPPDELPIVMLADRATTGGYPKIATVVSADVARLAQLMPGERLRFKAVSLEEVQGR